MSDNTKLNSNDVYVIKEELNIVLTNKYIDEYRKIDLLSVLAKLSLLENELILSESFNIKNNQ